MATVADPLLPVDVVGEGSEIGKQPWHSYVHKYVREVRSANIHKYAYMYIYFIIYVCISVSNYSSSVSVKEIDSLFPIWI